MSDQADLVFHFAHLEGRGAVSFLDDSNVASCGVDGLIKIWNIQEGSVSSEEDIDDEHSHSILFLLSTSKKTLISGSSDCNIVEHKKEGTEWKLSRTLAKTTSEPRTAVYIPETNTLVLGLKEGKMVSLSLEDTSSSHFLPAHPDTILHITKHPTQAKIATFCADGCIRLWDCETKKVLTTETMLPSYSNDIHGEFLGLDWSIQNQIAVCSGLNGELTVFSCTPNWNLTKQFTLQNNDQTIVTRLAFSPDGNHLCSSSGDGEIIMYDISTKEAIKETAHDEGVVDLLWNPTPIALQYQLILLDSQGQIALWDKAATKKDIKIQTNVIKPELSESEEIDIAPQKKRLIKCNSSSVVLSDDESLMVDDIDMNDDNDDDDDVPSRYHGSFGMREKVTPLQEAFQVGSTPIYKNKTCLNWTLLGMVVSTVGEDGTRMIDITLHDSSKTQPKRMTDHFNFTKAALGENGIVFSSEVDERAPATVFYRPFESWTSNSEWRVQLDYSEQVLGLSIGTRFVSIGTDQQSVRILSTGGVQCGLLSLPGPFLCSSAFSDKLAIVYHRSAPFNDSQSLGVMLYDATLNVVTHQQDVCISPRSNMHWLGWDEDCTLVSVDTFGVVRSLVFGSQPVLREGSLTKETQAIGMWTPISQLINHEDMFHWMVGCTKDQLVFVECTVGDKYPILLPSYVPPLCSLPYSAPLLPQTLEGENQVFVTRTQLQSTPDAALIMKRQQVDKSLLRLFHASCNDDKLQKALDFAHLMMFPKAMDIAIQVASSANISSLVEHLDQLKAVILQNASKPAVPQTNTIYMAPQKQSAITPSRVSEIEKSEDMADAEELSEKENLPAHPSPIRTNPTQLKDLNEELRQSPSKEKITLRTDKVVNPFLKHKEKEKGLFTDTEKVAGTKRKFNLGENRPTKRVRK